MKTMEWELFRLLTDCLKKGESAFDAARLTDLSSERWQAFLTLAKTQRVMPLLWHLYIFPGTIVRPVFLEGKILYERQ